MAVHYGEDTFPRSACGRRLSNCQLYSTRHDEIDCPKCSRVIHKFPGLYPDHPHGFNAAGKDPIKLRNNKPNRRKGQLGA